MLQTFDMIIREIHIGLWFLVVGYYFLIFVILFLFRWRKTRNPFQLAMAIFFILLAIGRVFYFIGDFFADSASLRGTLETHQPWLGQTGIWVQAGGFFQWMALAALAATAGFLIIGKQWAEITFAVPAVIVGIGLVLFSSELMNNIAGGVGIVYALFIPILFWYLAWVSGGVLRKSNFVLGTGFLVLFTGRVIHAGRFTLEIAGILSYEASGILAPGLVVIGLILITAGNEWGQVQ
ncbi:MAG: hypothetical protein P1Q69_01230 [Candidatus Thorarchaeota archaeon]|nr:hypothetical protein [Candidatus Thorarchaeota archaeon]